MSSTHDHEDRVRYWLTDAVVGGQPIPDEVSVVMSRPKSKVYNIIVLSNYQEFPSQILTHLKF